MTTDDRATVQAWDESGLSRVMRSELVDILVRAGRTERLFNLARDAGFLTAQMNDLRNARPDEESRSPLSTLDVALSQAVAQQRPVETVEFLLARAHWERRISADPALATRSFEPGHGSSGGADTSLRDRSDAQRAVLWQLLLAWEQYDSGNPGAARTTLQRAGSTAPPRLDPRASGCAVALLARIGDINVHRMHEYQQLLDENDRPDLCRKLIAEKRLAEAAKAAESIRLWPHYRVHVLAEVVRAATEAGQTDIATRATVRATQSLADVRADEMALCLARLAGAQARTGDLASAETFREAMRRLGSADDPERVLLALAEEQDDLGNFEGAEVAIGRLDDTHQRLEALEHHAIALARAGAMGEAIGYLRQIGDSDVFPNRRRAVMQIATLMAEAGDPIGPVDLIDRLLAPEERAMPVAHVVPLLARSDVNGALTLADRIDEPSWRASAFVEVAAIAAVPDALVRAAVDAVPEAASRAILFARYAMSRDIATRESLLDEVARRARADDQKSRWRTFAEVAIVLSDAGLPSGTLFEEARATLLAETDDAWEDGRDLWTLGGLQYQYGDPAGARQTYAAVLAGDDREVELRLTVLGLLGVAAEQARHAGPDAAVGAVEGTALAAVRGARHLDADKRRELANQALETFVPELEVESPVDLVRCFVAYPDSPAQSVVRSLSDPSARRPLETYPAPVLRAKWAGSVYAAWAAELGLLEYASVAMERVIRLSAEQISEAIGYLGREPSTFGRMKGYCRLARAAAELGDRTRATELHRRAVAAAEAETKSRDAGAMLVGIARWARWSGDPDLGREILVQAQQRIPSVDRGESRDSLANLVAKEQAAEGDIDGALATAASIDHEALRGEATLWAAAFARPVFGLPHSIDLIRGIASPYWRANGLVLASAGLRAMGEPTAAIDDEAQLLLAAVPEGRAQTWVLELRAEASLVTGDHAQAVGYVAGMLVDRPRSLLRLAHQLADRGDCEAVLSLVPVAAKQAQTASVMCGVLAGLFPEAANRIADELYRYLPAGEPPRDDEDNGWADTDEEDDRDQDDDGVGEYLTDLTGGIPLSEPVEVALLRATAYCGRPPITSADLLRSLEAIDSIGDWSRIGLSWMDGLAHDPNDGPPVVWSGTEFTHMRAQGFGLATLFSIQRNLLPLTVGALAVGLITDPRSAAAQMLGIATPEDHERVLRLMHEDLLGFDMS